MSTVFYAGAITGIIAFKIGEFIGYYIYDR